MARRREFYDGISATFVPRGYWEISIGGEFVGNVDDGELMDEILRLEEERREGKNNDALRCVL